MTRLRMLLLGLILLNCYAHCKGKDTVPFLMSDAKQPNFDLEAFQGERNEAEDSIASESIILPTLNLESHPFAVIVLPNIGKETSSETPQNKSLTTDKENTTQINLNFEKTIDELKGLNDEISIYSLRKNKGETIKLTIAEKDGEPASDEESNETSVIDQTAYENTTNVDHKAKNVEINSIPNKNVYSSPPIILKKSPLKEKEQDILRQYLPQDLSFSSKTPLNSEVKSRETVADDLLQTHKRNIIKNEIENSFLQIQTLPIVNQFNGFQNFSLLEIDQNSASRNKFSKNRGIDAKGSSNDHHVNIPTGEEELRQEDNRWAEILVVPFSVVKNVQKGNERLQETSNLNADQTKISESTNEFSSSEDYSTQQMIDLESESSTPIKPLLVKIVDLANSSASGADSPTNNFELMKGVGLSPSYYEIPAQNHRITDTINFFDTIKPNKEVTRLVELRNQPNSLKNLEKEKPADLNPQKDAESLKFYELKHKNLAGFQKLGKSLNNSIAVLEILPTVTINQNSEASNVTHDATSHTKPLATSAESDDILNWSNFVRTINKTDEVNINHSTTNEVKEYPNFSILESVITPIRPQFIETIAPNENINKTFNVVMEPFNISDAIPHRDQTGHENSNENPSQNTSTFHFYPTNENQPFSFPDIDISQLFSNTYDQNFRISPSVKTYRTNSVSISEISPSNFIPSKEIHNSDEEILATDVQLSETIKEEKNSFEIGCHGNELGCSDEANTPVRQDFVRHLSEVTEGTSGNDNLEYFDDTINLEYFDDTINSNPKLPISTESATVTRTNPPSETIIIIKGGSDLLRVSETPLSSSVWGGLAESTAPIAASTLLQDNARLNIVTEPATVTANTPSAPPYTTTETIRQKEFVTVTKTVASQNLRSSKLLHHATAIKPSTVTVTHTVDSVTTITQTLYSTVCDNIDEDYPDDEYFTQLNNYGLNAKNLGRNPLYTQLRDYNRRREHLNPIPTIPYFDELYWPKEPKTSKDGPNHIFLEDQYASDIEPFTQSYYPESDSIPQGTSSAMSVTLSAPGLEARRARQINLFPHSQLYYGIPFYGSEALNRKFLKIDPDK